MTSRNSFLARLIENAKRRIWLLVVSLLTFVLAIPTFTAMSISVISQRENLIEQMKVQEALYEFASNLYKPSNGVIFIFVGMFAIASGIQGFSYLYDRNKIDFYHSKPVKAVTRFFSIWSNGILVWLIPYTIGTLINLVLFAANGILDVKLFGSAWLYLVLAIGLYLCLYHLAILALMMTGKLIVTCMGILVFLLYESCIRILTCGYFEYFYQFFYVGKETTWLTPVFSPITFLNYYNQGTWSAPVTMFFLLLFATGVWAIAFWCYKKRPSELAGSAMTFKAVKPVIKIGIAVPVGLAAGLVTCSIVSYEPFSGKGGPGFPIFIGILGVLITCCLIEVIYEADIKGIFRKKIHIVISFALAMVIALIFRFDLTGFDTRLPDAEDIEYATLITNSGSRYGNAYLDDNLKWITKEEYVNKYMRLTGDRAIAVRNLAERSIDVFLTQQENGFSDEYEYNYAVFCFHQKNGNVLCREIPVAVREETSISYIKQIENSEEFIRANENAMSEELMEVLNGNEWKIRSNWGNDMYEQELSRKQARELLELYRLDLMKDNYEIRSTELPAGEFSIYIEAKVSYSRTFNFVVYPSYTNCIKYLEENGFETKEYIPVEDVEKITITRYYDEEDKIYYEEYGYDSYYYEETVAVAEEMTSASATYTDVSQMQEILAHSYPENLGWELWYMDYPLEEEYRVRVFFKEDTQGYVDYGYEGSLDFIKGQIPEFVKQDLPEKPAATE